MSNGEEKRTPEEVKKEFYTCPIHGLSYPAGERCPKCQ